MSSIEEEKKDSAGLIERMAEALELQSEAVSGQKEVKLPRKSNVLESFPF